MLPKKKRVTKDIFQDLMKGGKISSTPLFLFYFKKSDIPQYGFSAPKGIFKKATQRNKFRRIGYNILRNIPLKSGSGVFIYKKQALSSTQVDIKENIVFILNKVGFL